MTYLGHLIVAFDEHVDGFDGEETFVHAGTARVGSEDVGCDDCGDVVRVHFAAALFVHLREGGCPVEECEQDFHRVSVALGK